MCAIRWLSVLVKYTDRSGTDVLPGKRGRVPSQLKLEKMDALVGQLHIPSHEETIVAVYTSTSLTSAGLKESRILSVLMPKTAHCNAVSLPHGKTDSPGEHPLQHTAPPENVAAKKTTSVFQRYVDLFIKHREEVSGRELNALAPSSL